jgi:hypothetical protein
MLARSVGGLGPITNLEIMAKIRPFATDCFNPVHRSQIFASIRLGEIPIEPSPQTVAEAKFCSKA